MKQTRTVSFKKGRRQDFLRPPSPPTSLPFKLRTAGFVENSPHHATLGTYNEDAMLTLFISGRGQFKAKGALIAISAGTFGMVLPSGDVGMLSSDRHYPYEHYYCRFAGSEALKTAERIRAQMKADFIPFKDWPRLVEAFERVISLARKYADTLPIPEKMSPPDAALALLLSLVEHRENKHKKGLSADDMTRYISERISAPVDLEKMADHFNVSKEHLCRAGKTLLGDTLYRVWFGIKMQWAMRLLRETAESVGDVALKCGYKDQFYFSRTFKSFTGKSPRAWRENIVVKP
jgi:AraC-like DNA-binding protein